MSRWSTIAARLPGRTDNEIKNYWHSHLKKRLKQNSIPPIQESDHHTLLRREIKNATRTSKPAANSMFTTHQKIQNSEDMLVSRQQSRLELVGSAGNESANVSGNSTPGVGEKNEKRDFATKESMNCESSNVMEFWYNILMEVAGNPTEMQKSLG